MKKTNRVFALLGLSFLALNACGQNQNGEFTPKLDTETACHLTVRGHYENFEALTAEFHNFNHRLLSDRRIHRRFVRQVARL